MNPARPLKYVRANARGWGAQRGGHDGARRPRFERTEACYGFRGGRRHHPGESAPLDVTLTQEGQAADAKAVGDALANVVTTIDTIIINGGNSIKQ